MTYLDRLKQLLPPWFQDDNPVLDAVLSGMAYCFDHINDLIGYASLQTRIKTMSDAWLDLMCYDFLGNTFGRRGLSDSSFKAAIIARIFREKVTRKSIRDVIFDMTGREPYIFEPGNPADVLGGYGIATGYGVYGYWGSDSYPYQCFITIYRPSVSGVTPVAGIAGYGSDAGGYSDGNYTQSIGSWSAYDGTDGVTLQLGDSDILDAINAVKPAATILWVQFLD